ncbi:MAG: hypothetical protein IKF72_11255 [Kiritimatiellae bacterium]|nr:hypothetical protein [Kiritimatiellia bacterium]
MAEDKSRETEAYLARIRRTIEASNRLVEQAGLRIRETDRMLEKQGLTREQVMAMHFSDAQIEAVNEELKRRGMDPLDEWLGSDAVGRLGGDEPYDRRAAESPDRPTSSSDAELAERQRKFGMMMKPFQI